MLWTRRTNKSNLLLLVLLVHKMDTQNKVENGGRFFLWGESWGGTCTLQMGLRLQNSKRKNFLGVLLQCPAVHAKIPPKPIVIILRDVLARFFPTFVPRYSCLIIQLLFQSYSISTTNIKIKLKKHEIRRLSTTQSVEQTSGS